MSSPLAINIIRIAQTTSTNDEARGREYGEGDLIVAERQTRGRGQRGNAWSSDEGKNLTFSLVVCPAFLPLDRQFLLSEAVSLAVTDTLSGFGIDARIKWPNDIYVGRRKIAGILIENDICGSVLSRSIVGIGLNVNQTEFDPSLPNPVSMSTATGEHYDKNSVLDAFCEAFLHRYDLLKQGELSLIERDYHDKLYLRGELHDYKLPDGTPLRGAIKEVKPSGELIISPEQGPDRGFFFKEIEF